MTERGKLIAIEGVDGAGKRTQADLLVKALNSRGITCQLFGFPQYQSFFGQLTAKFLNGEFGPLEAVDPRLSALLYAGDRFEAKPILEAALASGTTIIADRYIASNLAHQTARMPPEKRADFSAWLRQLEYGIYGLPREDLIFYLRLPAQEGQQRVAKKLARDYTELKQDLQEASLSHLEATGAVYDELARQENWVTVESVTAQSGKTESANDIHGAILQAIEARLIFTDATT